ncbi:M48 family metallopeptidase [Sphingosinicella humi]|uniref:M48 family metallopeptidase n=1 Tax=Allosphingosinicella humi TaxID=2068657 RepID=UPI001FB0E569|nr:M48 family metallopeptidase [Sphingosinicella humi]
MTSELSFEAGKLSVTLVVKPSPRARVLRLRVDPRTGGVVLTVPRGVSRRRALAWASGQREWIETALADIPPTVAIAPGGELSLYGVPHRIDWQPDHPRAVGVEDGRILTGGPADMVEPRLLRWLRQHARAILDDETRHYAAKAGVTVSRVGVGDPLSRWGSCSESGTIRYSWRLILAPDWVRRATVAHEVAHRVHMNHGPDFHALVERLFEADPTPARLWLRRHGAGLHRIGRRL